jgi:hypothetical protein
MRVDDSKKWRRRHWNLIVENYRHAPFFTHYEDIFREAYERSWEMLVELDVFLIERLMEILGLRSRTMFSSELDLGATAKTDRLIKLLRKVGATAFLEGPAGSNFIEEHKLRSAGIELGYHEYVHPVYRQQFEPFIPYLSVVDLVFNHGSDSLPIITSGSLKIRQSNIEREVETPVFQFRIP